jgi:hypothetical protein
MPHKNILLVQSFDKRHRHTWSVGLCGTVCQEPCCLLGSCMCFPCANFAIRKEVLGDDLGNYRCFQGYYLQCAEMCCPCQSGCGPCCLAAETVLCPHVSVMATRHAVQEKYNVQNTCAERCLIDCVICCDCMMCCVAEDSCLHHGLHCLAHCAMCVFMPCMQAQAHHQIKMETNPATQAFVPVAAPYVMQRD